MATGNVKRAEAFVNSKKVADLSTSSMKGATNGERQHAADGVVAITTGNPEWDFTFNTIRLTSPGVGQTTLEEAFQNQSVVTIAYKVGAKLYYCACKVTTLEFASEARTGTLTCVINLSSAETPQVA